MSRVNEKEIHQLRRQARVLWCKLPGYPGWPSRFCTPKEELELTKLKDPSSKVTQVAVCFFGLSPTISWVNEGSVLPFQLEPAFLGASCRGSTSTSSSSSMSQYAYSPNRKLDFDEKKFRDKKDYRSAVLEACRLQIYRETGCKENLIDLFPDYRAELLSNSTPSKDGVPRECTVCIGSMLSAPLDISSSTLAAWICTKCDDSCGPTGHLELIDAGIGDDGLGGAAGSIGKGEEKKRKAKTVDSLQDLNALVASAGSGGAASSIFRSGAVAPYATISHVPTSSGSENKRQKSIPQIMASIPDMFNHSSLSTAQAPNVGGKKGKLKDGGVRPPPPVPEEDETDDYCFVCDEGGTLTLCDFPGCVRIYHQACIWRTFPSPVDQGVTELAGERDLSSDDPWFCPVHHCSSCGMLEDTSVPLSVLGAEFVPSYLRLKAASLSVEQSVLEKCSSCPYSLCSKCSAKSPALVRDLCSFCSSPSPRVELASLLESVVSRMCSSKEAVPFLRPLLPVIDDDKQVLPTATFMEQDYLTQSQDKVCFSQSQPSTQTLPPPSDAADVEASGLLGILDKIRSCNYTAASQLSADLLTVRDVLARKLLRLGSMPSIEGRAVAFVEALLASNVDSSGNGGGGGSAATQGFIILETFDRLVQDAESFLCSIKSHTARAEKRIGVAPSISSGGFAWRSECHTEFYHNQAAKARPLATWLEYLGTMTLRKKIPVAKNDGRGGCFADGGRAPRESVSKLVEMVGFEVLLSDMSASDVLDGMRSSALREGVTNMEERSLANCLSSSSNLAEDEESVMLARMREITSRCLFMQQTLQKQQAQRRAIRDARVVEMVTASELPVVLQLKSANDGLRWQLAQRDRQLSAITGTIGIMQETMDALDADLSALYSEI